MGPGSGLRLPKPERRQKTKDRQLRVKSKQTKDVRAYVMGRERYKCRCCRLRPATNIHEIRFRSQGGKISRWNSVGLCGSGTDGCHGLIHERLIEVIYGPFGADGDLVFIPLVPKSADWLKVKVGESILSAPMIALESAE